MENLKWYPFYYNGNETNFLATKCGRLKKIRVEWLKLKLDNLGEIDFSTKKLHPNGYQYTKVQIKGLGEKTLQVQQIIASVFLNYKFGDKLVVDHINSIKKDNRLDNLQVITHRENCSREKCIKKGLPAGVSFFKRTKRYKSYITINYKQIHLGYFINPIDAHVAYLNKLKTLI